MKNRAPQAKPHAGDNASRELSPDDGLAHLAKQNPFYGPLPDNFEDLEHERFTDHGGGFDGEGTFEEMWTGLLEEFAKRGAPLPKALLEDEEIGQELREWSIANGLPV